MLGVFLFSVAVQWNDPDPLVWMAIYGAAAVACLLPLLGREGRLVPAVVGVTALVWAVAILPASYGTDAFGHLFDSFEMKDADVEVAREGLGLLIVAGWMAVLGARVGRASNAQR